MTTGACHGTADRRAELIAELQATKCTSCFGVKKRAQTFCGFCYHALPREMQTALYRRVGAGYQEARDAAVACLAAKFAPKVTPRFVVLKKDGARVPAASFSEACVVAGWSRA